LSGEELSVVVRWRAAPPCCSTARARMLPVADESFEARRIRPVNEEYVRVGDLVGYTCLSCKHAAHDLHRVVAIGSDLRGRFYTLRATTTPCRIRSKSGFGQIQTNRRRGDILRLR